MPHRLADRNWRLNNLYWIVDEAGNKVRFRPNAVQSHLFSNLWYLNCVLKSRQHGITTGVCILFLDTALFNSNTSVGFISHSLPEAENTFENKIKFAYDNLPDVIKEQIRNVGDNAKELRFSNGSRIRVSTSLRGDTVQLLHVSEFGKICRKYPDKAKEIVTGALNTVHAGQVIVIESTAEGNEGYFFDYCQRSRKMQMLGTSLTPLDFKFFFYGWWADPRNQLQYDGQAFPGEMADYFSELDRVHKIKLTEGQKLWYTKKWELQGTEVKREHPSTPDEAFESRQDANYYSLQFKHVYEQKRITNVSYDSNYPVDTWWDLGVNDKTVIWFSQTVGREIRLIDYHQGSGYGLDHYRDILHAKPYRYGRMVGPHDLAVKELSTGKSRVEIAHDDYGIDFEIAPRLPKQDQIESVRVILGHCWFDEEKCAEGIKALENYRKQWDDKNGCYKDTPLHNWASDGADAFSTLAVAHSFSAGKNVGFVPQRTINTGQLKAGITRRKIWNGRGYRQQAAQRLG